MEKLIDSYEGKVPIVMLRKFKKEAENLKISKKDAGKALEILKNAYENSKIDSGESIGVITAESFGEPSTQMSIEKNEKIIVKIKDRIRILKIGDFVDGFMKKYGSIGFDNSDVLPIKEEIYVPSLNREEKIEWKKVVELSRHKTDKKLLKLVTRSGRSIIATDNHSFVTRKNNRIIPIGGKELKVGDRIPVMKYLPENCIDELDLFDYIVKGSRFPLVEENGVLWREGTLSKPLPSKLKLDHRFGWFIGAYLAEGNATHGQINISNMNNFFINNVKLFLSNLLLDYKEVYHQRGFSFSRDLKINSSLLASFVINTCKTGSKNKIIPDFCFSANEEFVSGLLKGYFDGDGNVSTDRKIIRISSNSEELCKGISILLARFNIFSHKVKTKGQYGLSIPYKYAPLFLEKIGSVIEHKRKKLMKLAEEAKKFWKIRSYDYNDIISGFDDLLYNVAKKLGYRTRYINNFTKRQRIGRTTLYRYIKKFGRLAERMKIDISKELEIMKRMFYSDVVWDEIVKIENIKNKDYVYDLSVPGLETFTTFDGIVTHNTLNVFHFAGVAEVSINLGLPRLIELFDARKTIKTPMMEVFLKSPYNKDTNKVRRVAGLIKEVRLGKIASDFEIDIASLQIKVELNKTRLRELNLKESAVLDKLRETFKVLDIKRRENVLYFKSKDKGQELLELYKLKRKLKEAYISGIKKVSQVLPVKMQNEFVILTAGTNLKDILQVKEVDKTRTGSNDIFEVRKVLGIEAARQAVINEALKVMEDQGLDIDIRHIMFMADIITGSGEVKGITRSGITGEKKSVLARASFETPMKHLVNASLVGEEDELNSVVENVLLNQAVPLGTGLPDLIIKMQDESK